MQFSRKIIAVFTVFALILSVSVIIPGESNNLFTAFAYEELEPGDPGVGLDSDTTPPPIPFFDNIPPSDDSSVNDGDGLEPAGFEGFSGMMSEEVLDESGLRDAIAVGGVVEVNTTINLTRGRPASCGISHRCCNSLIIVRVHLNIIGKYSLHHLHLMILS